MTKLESFIRDRVEKVRNIRNEQQLQIQYRRVPIIIRRERHQENEYRTDYDP